jgi:hypothetical protein
MELTVTFLRRMYLRERFDFIKSLILNTQFHLEFNPLQRKKNILLVTSYFFEKWGRDYLVYFSIYQLT